MRRRRTILVLLPCLLAACGLIALQRHWRHVHSTEAVEHQAHLDARIPELNWNGLSLQGAVDQLRQSTGAKIQVSDQISNYVPGPYGRLPLRFYARLRDVRLSTALEILTSGSRSATNGRTTYDLLPDGTILILPEASARRIVRVYDVRDLLSDPAGRNDWGDPLGAAIQNAVNQVPLPGMKSSGRWTFVGTRREQACIDAALDAVRRPAVVLDQTNETADALERVVGPVHAHGVPVESIIDGLAAQARINLVIDWPALAQYFEIATPNNAVSVDFERLPLRAAINLLFKSRMLYAANENVLIVTAYYPPISFRQVRTYDLSDLVISFAERLRAQDAHAGRPRNVVPPEYYTDEAKSLLQELLERSAAAGTGHYRGGTGAWLGTRLLIASPADAHWELRRILNALRQFANESVQHPPAQPRFVSSGEDVFARLDTPVKEIAFDRAPLSTALVGLQSASGVTIGFDNDRYLVQFEPTRSVTLHLWNVPLGVALHQILKASSNFATLCYGTDQGVIIVSAEPLLWSVTRIYDISDIAEERRMSVIPQIVKVCIDEPISRQSGRNDVRMLGNWLIVTQTPENQLRIASLLDALRHHGTIEAGRLWPDN